MVHAKVETRIQSIGNMASWISLQFLLYFGSEDLKPGKTSTVCRYLSFPSYNLAFGEISCVEDLYFGNTQPLQ